MEGFMTNTGDGYGDGYGYGYGYGDGSGYGSGDGSGYGDGYGYGSGYGSGDGSGYGETIGRIGNYDVELIRPFSVIKVGCQAHTVAEWRQRWREIAKQEEFEVTEEEVARIEAAIELAKEL